ncbi:GDSL-type esterase/lipase family protein [Furfurilactobacillus curtus]|uniref:Lysophospholipase n=1 Tax=Furfurilactobacillus curtus TaxID=1746200 RepID=A0ABQ5JPB5_9LACO
MTDQTTSLTNLDPKIKAFQTELYAKYAIANQQVTAGQIVFVGSSLMEIFPIEKWEKERALNLPKHIYNRGVRATTTADLLAHLDVQIFDLAPSKIFINIGSNDLGFNVPETTFLNNYRKILNQIQIRLPKTQIYVMKYYPMNAQADFSQSNPEKERAVHQFNETRSNDQLSQANKKVADLAASLKIAYIDANAGLTDKNGYLKKELTFDGTHLSPAGFELVLNNLRPYFN